MEVSNAKVRHLSRFEVTPEILAAVLALPEGTKILNITWSPSRANVFSFTVEHPDLPEVEQGRIIPIIVPELEWVDDARPRDFITFKFYPEEKDGA